MYNNKEKKKAKAIKKCVTKNDLAFENYKESVLKNRTILRSQLQFKSDHHNVFAEEINKITISPNDDKRLQTFNGITIYSIGTNAFKVCESEMLARIKGKPIATYCESKYSSVNMRIIHNSRDFEGNIYCKNSS